jgi:hypothetical protein
MTDTVTRLLRVVLAITIIVAGSGVVAGASGQPISVQADESSPVTNADTVATLDNGTVTLTITDGDTPVESVTVTVEAETESDDSATDSDAPREIGQTDADGTVTFPLENLSRFEVDLSLRGFSGELEYTVTGDSLTLLEEEYEYADDAETDPGNGDSDEEDNSDDADDPDDPDDSDDPDGPDDPDNPDDPENGDDGNTTPN